MRIFSASLIILISLILLLAYGVENINFSKENLSETLTVHPERITQITLSNLSGDHRSTKDEKKIEAFMEHLHSVKYKRLINDQSGYMPMKAHIIYLHENEKVDFIVPYETEAMINHKVYRIKSGIIVDSFLEEFYNSLDEE